jgi:hypothetical protein
MQVYSNGRRNFLNNIVVLSAGTVFKPAIKHLPSIYEREDLQKKWESFWRKYGGKKYFALTNLQKNTVSFKTKGHEYKDGEVIYFSKENILAQPTWVYWENNTSKPSDVVITLFERKTFKKITRLNCYEADALYKVSKDHHEDNLLAACCNTLKPPNSSVLFLKNKMAITKNSKVQLLSYYKNQELILNKKFIYHS